MKLYDIEVVDNNGKVVSMSKYKGKVLLIVNTATGCGFTPHYKWLESLYKDYKTKDFVVLDFPCDQFGHQAPGSDEEINTFCTSNYGTSFPRFKKIEVNGENECELYKYIKSCQPFKSKGLKMKMFGLMSHSKNKEDVRWNFTKFLVNKNGEVVDRFEPTEESNVVRKKVEELINE